MKTNRGPSRTVEKGPRRRPRYRTGIDLTLTSAGASAAAELNSGLVARRRRPGGRAIARAIARVITRTRCGIRFCGSHGADARKALKVSRQLRVAQLADMMERLTLTAAVTDDEPAPRALESLREPPADGLCGVGVDADIRLRQQGTCGGSQRPAAADPLIALRTGRNKHSQRLPCLLPGLNRLAVIRDPCWRCGDRYFPEERDGAQSD